MSINFHMKVTYIQLSCAHVNTFIIHVHMHRLDKTKKEKKDATQQKSTCELLPSFSCLLELSSELLEWL